MNYHKIKPAATRAAALSAAAALIVGGLAAVSAQSNCITFESPLAGAVVADTHCIISLNVECRDVSKVDLQVHFIPERSDTPMTFPLGTLSRPPYKIIWNTSKLQNQLFAGVGILAEATIAGGKPQVALQEGIFLTHKPVVRKRIPMRYAASTGAQNAAGDSIPFPIKGGQMSAWGIASWNEKELSFQVSVKDPSFYSNQPGRKIADLGLEVMIDPARKRAPHPTDSALFFVVPLSGGPTSIKRRPEIADGAFKIVSEDERGLNALAYPSTVGVNEFKGYNIRFSVPREAFGRNIPDTIACNMAIRVFDAEGRVQRIALAGGNDYEIYSPITWNDYCKTPKPLLMNGALQWGVFSATGFLIALAIYAVIAMLRKPQLISNFERSEEAKVVFERVNTVIEQELIKKELKIDYVAGKCGMDHQALNALIKRNTGFGFSTYLQYCRSEVAKERLRSSRSSETSIADLCGFDSAIEMEKCFSKFYHTTPYKYRTQQQVA
jgi:AraC-like DNA-binding protein